MARDDMHVIVYRLLSYLYRQLKEGAEVDDRKIDDAAFGINRSYWAFIMKELREKGYTAGYSVIANDHGGFRIDHLERARITFDGVEYLTDDYFMGKVRAAETGLE